MGPWLTAVSSACQPSVVADTKQDDQVSFSPHPFNWAAARCVGCNARTARHVSSRRRSALRASLEPRAQSEGADTVADVMNDLRPLGVDSGNSSDLELFGGPDRPQQIVIVDYDDQWPERFKQIAD